MSTSVTDSDLKNDRPENPSARIAAETQVTVDQSLAQKGIWQALTVGVIGLLLLLALSAVIEHAHAPRGDELIYELMALDPFGVHTFPFGYRIGLPLLVHILPFSHTFSFTSLALLSAASAGGVMHLLLRRFGIPAWLSMALGVCLASSPPMLAAVIRNGRSVDPETVLIMLLATLFIVGRRPRALGVTLIAGALLRESSLFLIPFAYAIWAERPFDLKTARKVLIACGPAVALYCAIRFGITTVGREQVVGYGGTDFVSDRLLVLKQGLSEWGEELRRITLTFGPLLVLAPFAMRGLPFARRGAVLLLLTVVAITFALDWGRVLFLAAPVIYVSAAWTLRNRPRLALISIATLIAMNLGYATYLKRGAVTNITQGADPAYIVQ